jgi:hypothetical protein
VFSLDSYVLLSDHVFSGSGTLTLSGSGTLSSNFFSYIGSGVLVLYGTAPYATSSGILTTNHFVGSGNITLYGSASTNSSNKGELEEEITLDSELDSFVIFYTSKPGLNFPSGSTETTIDWCDCKLIPNRFGLKTNFDISSLFTDFIKYNNIY